jgi:hypothetical protein
MSVNVLRNIGPHTYLDDLESFFYVLCWIVTAFYGPGEMMVDTPPELSSWDQDIAASCKSGMLLFDRHDLLLQKWFGWPIHSLISHLFVFLKDRCLTRGKLLSALNPAADYDEYISHIRACVVELEALELQ